MDFKNFRLNITDGNILELLEAQKPIILELHHEPTSELVMLYYNSNSNSFTGHTQDEYYVEISEDNAYIRVYFPEDVPVN